MGSKVGVYKVDSSGYGKSSCGTVDGRLAWVKRKKKFKVKRGNTYQVKYDNPKRTMHKDAVGVYVGSRISKNSVMATLECCGKKFRVDATTLMPWKGEITSEHLKFISPKNKYHLKREEGSACKCDCSGFVNPEVRLLSDEDFLSMPESTRCVKCGYALKREIEEQG